MALSELYVDGLIKQWMKSTDGKAELKKRGLTSTGYSLVQMKEIGKDLRIDLYHAIIGVGIKSFDLSSVSVQTPVSDNDNNFIVRIYFPDEILKRKSLWTGGNGKYNGYTGDGIYDVVGIFTNGYRANKQVFGYWIGHENSPYTASKVYRAPNSFISKTIAQFNAKYPGINILYPSLWGGTL